VARPRIGVIGLGGMGTALTGCLLRAGYPVTVHDRRPAAVAPLTGQGADAAGSPRELAGLAGLVLTFLPGPAEVEQVALDPDTGVLAGLGADTPLLDLSTCGPDTAERIGAAFDAAGRTFLDCPVSRKAPEMTVLVGGEPGVLGPAAEVLGAVSRTIIHCGRRGAGYAVKLLNQHVKYAWYLAASEALLVAREHGIDPGLAADAIARCSGGESGLSAAAEWFRQDADAMRTHAPARTIAKDSLLARELAAAAGVHSPTLDVVAEFFATALNGTPYPGRPYPEATELLARLRTEA
jgi:3-hydroxyisobutyrate dehydrogenase-like beta-hydroxyacid dehydrogenase